MHAVEDNQKKLLLLYTIFHQQKTNNTDILIINDLLYLYYLSMITNFSNEKPTTYTHNDDNQLIQEETNGAITNYTYDHNGNMQTKSNGTDSYYYLYDEYNRLTEVRKNGVTIQTNVYDAFGRRIKKITQKGTRQYFYNGNSVALEITEDNKTIRHFGAAFQINGDRFFGIHDIRGSLIAIMNNVGTIVREVQYSAYGEIISDSNPNFGYDYLFAGGVYDRNIKLAYHINRYYDPAIGRWTTPDPIGAVASGSINLYQYCGNDPVNYIDPDGLLSEKAKRMIGIFVDYALGGSQCLDGGMQIVGGAASEELTAGASTLVIIKGFFNSIDGAIRFTSAIHRFSGEIQGKNTEDVPTNIGGIIGAIIDKLLLNKPDSKKYQDRFELGNDIVTVSSAFGDTISGVVKGIKALTLGPTLIELFKGGASTTDFILDYEEEIDNLRNNNSCDRKKINPANQIK